MLQRIRNAWWALRQSPNLPLSTWERMLDAVEIGVPTSSGVTVSERNGARQATAFACINILSRDMAALPLKMYERKPNGGRAEVTEHDLAVWLRRPNDYMTPMQYRQAVWVSVLTTGNDYSRILRNPGNEYQARPLPPAAIEPVLRGGRKFYELRQENGQTITLRPEQVLHTFGYPDRDGLMGVSPIRHCMETFGRAIAVGEYGAAYFRSPVPKVVFKAEAGFDDDAAKESFLAAWKEKFSGKKGLTTAAVMPPGLAIDQIVKIPNEEAQFIETQKFGKEEIAQIYLVPLHRLNALDRATFSNIEHQSLEYVQYTLLPWLTAYEQAIEKQFLNPLEQERFFVRHIVDGLLRGDHEARMKGHATSVQFGIYTINERRALENLPAIPGGDDAIVPLNLVKLKDLDAPEPVDEPNDDPPDDEEPVSDSEQDDDERSRKLNLRNGISAAEFRAASNRRVLAQRFVPRLRSEFERLDKEETDAVRRRVDTLLRSEVRTVDEFTEWVRSYFATREEQVTRAIMPLLSELSAQTRTAALEEVEDGEAEISDAFVAGIAAYTAARWTGSAAAQLTGVASEAMIEGDDPADAVRWRLDEWNNGGQGGTRAQKQARRTSFTTVGAIATAVFNAIGLGVRWVTFGKNCPYCDSLSGKRVAPGQSFVPIGDFQPDGADRPLRIRGPRKHPPIHGGCDCMVAPG